MFLQFANNIKDVLFIIRPHATRVMWVSRSVEELFGYPLEDHYTNPMLIMQCVVPEDKARVAAFMEETEIFSTAADKRNDLEYRITRKDGQVRWLWTRVFPSFGLDGKVNQICGFTHDITDRKEGERRVSEFYSTVSHELRTPLTSIRAALGLIEGGITDPGSDESLELIGIARREADRLIRLINDILDMRKMEAGKLPMTLKNLEPSQVVNSTIDSLRSFAQEQDVKLESAIHDNQVFVGDYDRVVQVLNNLLSNAVKFSPRGTTVKVSVKASFNGRLRFAVIDEGPGIPKEEQSKLFGVFQQLDSSDSREVGGTGLGLAISKAIVEKLGGAIGFTSSMGDGSTFWFELPIAGALPLYPEGAEATIDVTSRNTALRNFVEEYAAILPTRIASLKLRMLDAKKTGDKSSLEECLLEVRKIRASAEPCGFFEVARTMVQVEQLLEYIDVGQGNSETLWAQIESLLSGSDRLL